MTGRRRLAASSIRRLLIIAIALPLLGSGAAASEVYQCRDSAGRLIFQDEPCGKGATGKQIKARKPVELTGETLDAAMWVLLEDPFKSDDARFIAHVRYNNLLHSVDSDGDTVLSIAALNGQTGVIDFLVENGVDVNHANNQGYSILSFAMKLDDAVRLSLLQHGADINHAGDRGRTPLINAVLYNDEQTVGFLLEYDADADHVDDTGATALFYAASRGNMDIVKQLVEAGADVNSGSRHKPLKGALANKNLLIGTYLAFKGATP